MAASYDSVPFGAGSAVALLCGFRNFLAHSSLLPGPLARALSRGR
ncbi:hypothetical protein [Hymenobacter cellulosivorans]|nr:hypothetical protein [Hymenobacter cellulosivorans]